MPGKQLRRDEFTKETVAEVQKGKEADELKDC